MSIETKNEFFVGVTSTGLTIMMPPVRGQVIEREAALRLAAYIVTLIDDVDSLEQSSGPKFTDILKAVSET